MSRAPRSRRPALVVLAGALGGLSCDTVPIGSGLPNEPTVLIVTDLDRDDRAAEEMVLAERVRGLGFAVQVLDEGAAALPDIPSLAAVIVSSVATAATLTVPVVDAAVPVAVLESYAWPQFGMTGAVEEVDYTALYETDVQMAPLAPLGAGLTGRARVLTEIGSGWRLNAGRPGPGATVSASVPDEPALAAIFSYEGAAQMVGRPAPARRLALFLRTEAIPYVTEDGWRLFDAGMRWLAGR